MDPSTCATHRGLLISEITGNIVGWLRATGRKKYLASLARTCKAFQEESTPALWEHLDSLSPLLQLLPPDAWSLLPDENVKFPFTITHPQNLDWTRFDHYAEYVRHFEWRGPQRTRWDIPGPRDISSKALSALATYRPTGQPLMPKLHTLFWEEHDPELAFHPNLFLPPTILRLQLFSEVLNPSKVTPLLAEVGAACGNLTHLRMSVYDGKMPWTDADYDAFARILRGMPKLEALEGYSDLSVSCVEALAALPKLATLELHTEDMNMDALATSAVSGARAGQWFNALRCLRLGALYMDGNTTTFLAAIRSQGLQELKFLIEYEPETHALKKRLRTLARSPYRHSLNIFDFFTTSPFQVDGAEVPLDLEHALQPLYAFPHIRLLTIRSRSFLAGASRALHDIANAWPELESLVLASYKKDPVEAVAGCITLEDLVQLTRRCPRLRDLQLHLNAEVVPDATTLARLMPEPSQSPLGLGGCMVVHNAPIVDPGQVADFLARLFPALESVIYMGADLYYEDGKSDPSTFLAKWWRVKRLLGEKNKALKKAASGSSSSGRPSTAAVLQTPYLRASSW
ncbi:hypothetical protein TRAPUB_4767 [Trametes pubescens]|uniref:F-box domain-containing protein n=1 Tax=Trametes pubescens TaxID=154538 RepID=A0A1M2VAE7_TRAPU|nr:hypothetical protein TRAPUB_4767 [Trametes pubescens]